MLRSQSSLFSSANLDKNESAALQKFVGSVGEFESLLVVIGGGTAALTYLYTHDLDKLCTHVLILGDRGYWQTAAHRLAQPHHILALPHSPSDDYVDPAHHDEANGILPHEPTSAYVHSKDYQNRLAELEQATLAKLRRHDKKVFAAKTTQIENIEKVGAHTFQLRLKNSQLFITAQKVIIASGAGPARRLPADLHNALLASAIGNGVQDAAEVQEKILDYTDALTPVVEKCRDKKVVIYGGGATAAWAMEVAALTAKPLAWVAKSGFDEAVNAGPRVKAIIDKSQSVQCHGLIEKISYDRCPMSGDAKLLIVVKTADLGHGSSTITHEADYLINCIGQEQYELGGLPYVLCPRIKDELVPVLDKNHVTGHTDDTMLGWGTGDGDLLVIGAAQGTYYNRDKQIKRSDSVSKHLPRSGQVPITIGGVVSSVCALTNYMPVKQNLFTGRASLESLNLHVMNATQLSVYFTANFPDASAREINHAVSEYIAERASTEFGLSPQRLQEFLRTHFAKHAHTMSCPDLRKKF